MKRETLILTLIILAIVAGTAGGTISAPSNFAGKWLGIFFTNASTGAPETVTSSNPLPVIGTFSASVSGGTFVVTNVASFPSPTVATSAMFVASKGATSVAGEFVSITSTPSSWTMSAAATDFAIWNVGTTTVWIDFNSSGATVSAGLPLTASGTISRDAAEGVVVWLVSSSTTQIYRAEGRR